jgi:protein-disulfide isomerase
VDIENLSRAERKRLLRKKRKEEKRSERLHAGKKKLVRTISVYAIVTLVVVATAYFLFKPKPAEPLSVLNEPFLGAPEAPLTIVEFGDFQCPYTRQFNTDILKRLEEQYRGRVRFVFKDMITRRHQYSDTSSMAAQCANEQGKFREYHDLLFQRQGRADDASLRSYAKEVGLDMDLFNQCMDSERYKDEVWQDTREGRDRGVRLTPTLFVGDVKIEGIQTLSTYKQYIDYALSNAG